MRIGKTETGDLRELKTDTKGERTEKSPSPESKRMKDPGRG